MRRPNIEHCHALGDALAHFHLAGADFPMFRANDLSLPGWRPLVKAIGAGADEVVPGLAAEIEKELSYLEQRWPSDLPEGVIHADLFPDNVFFLGDKVSGLIDFYFACNDTLAYDLAICLNAWCFEADGSFNITKARAMLQAYEGVRPLSEAELKWLPTLARGGALRFLLTRTYDWLNTDESALVRTKDPNEYLRKLQIPSAGEVLSRLWAGEALIMTKPKVIIHTDGACSGNPGPGGWGVILQSGEHRKELSGGEPMTTNNRMELTAAIRALEALKGSSEVEPVPTRTISAAASPAGSRAGRRTAGAPPTASR